MLYSKVGKVVSTCHQIMVHAFTSAPEMVAATHLCEASSAMALESSRFVQASGAKKGMRKDELTVKSVFGP